MYFVMFQRQHCITMPFSDQVPSLTWTWLYMEYIHMTSWVKWTTTLSLSVSISCSREGLFHILGRGRPLHAVLVLCLSLLELSKCNHGASVYIRVHHGPISPLLLFAVTDEFMLPTPTTTHLLQPPPTALVPWWVAAPPCPLLLLLSSLPPHPSWGLRMGWWLKSSHFPLIEFVSCANSS